MRPSHHPFAALCSLNSQPMIFLCPCFLLSLLISLTLCSWKFFCYSFLSTWVQALICARFVPTITWRLFPSGFLINFPWFSGLIPPCLLISSFQNPLSVISSASASLRASYNINICESYTNQDTFINVIEKIIIHKGQFAVNNLPSISRFVINFQSKLLTVIIHWEISTLEEGTAISSGLLY